MGLRLGRKVNAGSVVFAVAALLASVQASPPQGRPRMSAHYYDVKTEIRIEGVVQSVRFEPRYQGAAPFLILVLDEPKTSRRFIVEIGPAWFFERDVHQGERMNVLGSLASTGDAEAVLIAREVQFQGEIVRVRDARGFPNWRGGPRQAGKRKRGR